MINTGMGKTPSNLVSVLMAFHIDLIAFHIDLMAFHIFEHPFGGHIFLVQVFGKK